MLGQRVGLPRPEQGQIPSPLGTPVRVCVCFCLTGLTHECVVCAGELQGHTVLEQRWNFWYC